MGKTNQTPLEETKSLGNELWQSTYFKSFTELGERCDRCLAGFNARFKAGFYGERINSALEFFEQAFKLEKNDKKTYEKFIKDNTDALKDIINF